jgi:hypothetical protein
MGNGCKTDLCVFVCMFGANDDYVQLPLPMICSDLVVFLLKHQLKEFYYFTKIYLIIFYCNVASFMDSIINFCHHADY